MLPWDRPEEFVLAIEALREADRVRAVEPVPEYVWPRVWLLALIVGLLGLEWIGRRYLLHLP